MYDYVIRNVLVVDGTGRAPFSADVALMTKDDKIKAIRYLNESGAFTIMKAGQRVCNFFGISKYTLYSYIDESKGEKDK